MKLLDWLHQEPFTLSLSSGFFGFFAHTGLLTALEEENLVPKRITGSSSGALAGACWAAGMDSIQLRASFFELKKQDFWDFDWQGAWKMGLLKGNKFRQKLTDILPVKSFAECRIPLTVSAYDLRTKNTICFDQGGLVEAVYASCALPFLFQPITIEPYKLLDGGIKDRPALASIVEQERVFYHHIASRSWWRKKGSKALETPVKNNLSTLAIHDLPRSGPNNLEAGKEAYQRAYFAAKRALNMELQNAKLVVAA